jgi:hypothetical protein
MPLNFVHPDIRVTIGSEDWTDWIVVLRVSEGRFDPQQPYTKTGEFEIVPTTKPFPVNPSHRENQAYWRPFAKPVKVYLQGELIATLRIQKYLWKNDGDRWSGRGELVDLLAKSDTGSPTSDFGLPIGSDWTQSVISALESVGIGAIDGLPIPPINSNAVPSVKRDGSPIQFAAELCGLHGAALCLTPEETPAIVFYAAKDPSFRLPREGVDEFEFQDDAETYDQVVVSGSRQIAKRRDDENAAWTFDFPTEQYGWIPTVAIADGKYVDGNGPPVWGLVGTTRNWKNGIDSEGTETTAAAGAIWTHSPIYSGSSTQVLTEGKTILNTYDVKGRLVERITNSTAAEGALYPAEREGISTAIIYAQIVETWDIDPFEECVRLYTKVESKRSLTSVPSSGAGGGSPDLTHTDLREYTHTIAPLTTTAIVVESWRPSQSHFSTKASNQPWVHHVVERGEGQSIPLDSEKGRIKRGPLVTIRSDVELVDGPPKPEARPPRREIVDEPFRVAVTAKDASQPYRTLEVGDDRLDTDAEARAYGELLLRLYWSRYYGRFVTLPARRRYWQDLPLQVSHIDTQGLIMEGRVLAWVRGEPAKIAFFGNHLGDIPQVPYQPLAINADFSGPALEYLAGTPIEHLGIIVPPLPPSIVLPPTQPPYTVGTVTNLPTGLSVSVVNQNAGQPELPPYWSVAIVGTPAEPYTGTAEIILVPAPEAIAQPPITVTIPIVVAPPPEPVPPPPLEFVATEVGQSYWTSIALGTLYPNWLLSEARDNWVDLQEEVLWVDALTS